MRIAVNPVSPDLAALADVVFTPDLRGSVDWLATHGYLAPSKAPDLDAIDWPVLGRGILWVFGLSVALAAFSHLRWAAKRAGVPLRIAMGWDSFLAPFFAGLVLFAAGMALGRRPAVGGHRLGSPGPAVCVADGARDPWDQARETSGPPVSRGRRRYMRRISEAVGWGIFLLVAGAFLLLKNLGVFGPWGEVAWAAFYTLAGLGFLIWFFTGTEHWWRAIPAFTLLGIGAGMLAAWRNVELGAWAPALVLLGMALGFWAILIVRKEHWWALVPAGVLTTVAVMLGLWSRLDPLGRLAVLLTGIGLMFLLLYVMRYDEHDARWAAVPAGALLLLGAVTLVTALPLPAVVKDWWPILLVIGGALLIILGLARRKSEPVTNLPHAGRLRKPAARTGCGRRHRSAAGGCPAVEAANNARARFTPIVCARRQR